MSETMNENVPQAFVWKGNSADKVVIASTVTQFNRDAMFKALKNRVGQPDKLVELITNAQGDVTDEIHFTVSPLTVTDENGEIRPHISGDMLVKIEFVGLNKAAEYRALAHAVYGKVRVVTLRINTNDETAWLADGKNFARGVEIGDGYMHEYTDANKAKQSVRLWDILAMAMHHAKATENRFLHGQKPLDQTKGDNPKSVLTGKIAAQRKSK